jgi:uncharacterized membrane protein YeaQ/YmgE (transglycosylase-associated protein family)
MYILAALGIGGFVGILASLFATDSDTRPALATVPLGMLGGVLGGMVGCLTGADGTPFDALGDIATLAGSMLVLVLFHVSARARVYTSRRLARRRP